VTFEQSELGEDDTHFVNAEQLEGVNLEKLTNKKKQYLQD